jgi:hypothetical protein
LATLADEADNDEEEIAEAIPSLYRGAGGSPALRLLTFARRGTTGAPPRRQNNG